MASVSMISMAQSTNRKATRELEKLSRSTSEVRKETRSGNRAYSKKDYEKAETQYRKALSHDSTYYRAHYNMGNSAYRQKKYDEATQHYGKALQNPAMDKKDRSRTLHNMGNSELQAGLADKANGMQHFQNAVNNYQGALKLDPKNQDTKYNLSYAKKMLRQAQQQQQNQQQNGGGQNNQQNKDQQDKQNQNQNQNKQDQKKDQQNKNQQNQNPDNQDQQKKPQDNKPEDQKKQDAERLLQAVSNNEKQTLKNQHQKADKVRVGKIEKDW